MSDSLSQSLHLRDSQPRRRRKKTVPADERHASHLAHKQADSLDLATVLHPDGESLLHVANHALAVPQQQLD